MQQLEFFDIPSPCRRVCQTNSKGYCIGCYRNRDERLYWNDFSNEQRRIILKRCRARKIREIKEKKLALNSSLPTPKKQPSFFD